jgi:hypothetical protein
MLKQIVAFTMLVMLTLCVSCSEDRVESQGSISGVITDHTNGEPIPNASVVLNPSGKTQLTGSDGYYEYSELDPMQYTITVQKAGYSTNRKTITVVAGKRTEANIPLTKD